MSIIGADTELSGVHPTDWKLTRERLRAIEHFLAGQRTPSDLRATAESLQLSVSRLRRLARSYELHKDARALSGSRRGGPRGTSDSRRAFARDAIGRAIGQLGTLASARDINEVVARECEGANLRPPTIQQIWKSLAAARRQNRAPARGMEPSLIVGRVWFQIPVVYAFGEAARRPEAVIVLELPSKLIRACVADFELGRIPLAWDAIDGLECNLPIHATSIELGPCPAERKSREVVTNDGAQAELVRCLGNGIGDLEILFRKPRSTADSLVTGPAGALSLIEAGNAIAMAIARHEAEIRAAS